MQSRCAGGGRSAAAVVVTLEADEAVASKGADVVDADAVGAATFLEALVDVDASLAVESVEWTLLMTRGHRSGLRFLPR